MRQIKVFQENTDTVILYDKDFSDFSTYVKQISEIMKSDEVSILEATSGSMILKPSKIVSILVSVDDDNNKEDSKIKEENLDIISDGE